MRQWARTSGSRVQVGAGVGWGGVEVLWRREMRVWRIAAVLCTQLGMPVLADPRCLDLLLPTRSAEAKWADYCGDPLMLGRMCLAQPHCCPG